MAAILAIGAVTLNSCVADIADNPVTPSPTDQGAWTLNSNLDQTYKAGDNFYMHAIGSWWKTAVIDEKEGVTDLFFEVGNQTKQMIDNLNDEGMERVGGHVMDLTSNAETDNATLKKAEEAIAGADSREAVYRIMGKLARQGYQMPFHVACIPYNDKLCFIFLPPYFSEFMTHSIGGMDYNDDTIYGDGDGGYGYGDWGSIVKGSPRAEQWKRLFRHPRLDEILVPVKGGSGTRGFQREQWPMLVAVCEGLGVNPDEAYIINETFDEDVAQGYEKFSLGPVENLKKIQEMDIESLKEEVLAFVNDDRIIFDETYESPIGKLGPQSLMGTLSANYLLYYSNYVFAMTYVTPEVRQRGRDMVGQLKETFRSRIEENTWLNAASKANALEKLDAMVLNIAYPDWIEEGLPDFSQTRSFLEDAMEMRRAFIELMVRLTGMSRTEGSFHDILALFANLSDVNAFYAPEYNAINIMPIWLMSPYYEEGAALAYNYATLMVFGHEMTHAFDTSGSQWDKYGNRGTLWASPADEQEFNRRSQLLAKYYSTFEVLPGVYADGQKTLGENIADLGGVELALQMLTDRLRQLGFSGDEMRLQQQRFFYAVANLWRAKYNEAYIMKQLKGDVHSLPSERINGVVSNMDAWYDLFDVEPGQKLYRTPAERIKIW